MAMPLSGVYLLAYSPPSVLILINKKKRHKNVLLAQKNCYYYYLLILFGPARTLEAGVITITILKKEITRSSAFRLD